MHTINLFINTHGGYIFYGFPAMFTGLWSAAALLLRLIGLSKEKRESSILISNHPFLGSRKPLVLSDLLWTLFYTFCPLMNLFPCVIDGPELVTSAISRMYARSGLKRLLHTPITSN